MSAPSISPGRPLRFARPARHGRRRRSRRSRSTFRCRSRAPARDTAQHELSDARRDRGGCDRRYGERYGPAACPRRVRAIDGERRDRAAHRSAPEKSGVRRRRRGRRRRRRLYGRLCAGRRRRRARSRLRQRRSFPKRRQTTRRCSAMPRRRATALVNRASGDRPGIRRSLRRQDDRQAARALRKDAKHGSQAGGASRRSRRPRAGRSTALMSPSNSQGHEAAVVCA